MGRRRKRGEEKSDGETATEREERGCFPLGAMRGTAVGSFLLGTHTHTFVQLFGQSARVLLGGVTMEG